MNLLELIKDDRGMEMVLHLHHVTDDKVVFCYQNLIDYVNRVGIDEAYSNYLKQKEIKE